MRTPASNWTVSGRFADAVPAMVSFTHDRMSLIGGIQARPSALRSAQCYPSHLREKLYRPTASSVVCRSDRFANSTKWEMANVCVGAAAALPKPTATVTKTIWYGASLRAASSTSGASHRRRSNGTSLVDGYGNLTTTGAGPPVTSPHANWLPDGSGFSYQHRAHSGAETRVVPDSTFGMLGITTSDPRRRRFYLTDWRAFARGKARWRRVAAIGFVRRQPQSRVTLRGGANPRRLLRNCSDLADDGLELPEHATLRTGESLRPLHGGHRERKPVLPRRCIAGSPQLNQHPRSCLRIGTLLAEPSGRNVYHPSTTLSVRDALRMPERRHFVRSFL